MAVLDDCQALHNTMQDLRVDALAVGDREQADVECGRSRDMIGRKNRLATVLRQFHGLRESVSAQDARVEGVSGVVLERPLSMTESIFSVLESELGAAMRDCKSSIGNLCDARDYWFLRYKELLKRSGAEERDICDVDFDFSAVPNSRI